MKYLFIVNPNSGNKNPEKLIDNIHHEFQVCDYKVEITKSKGHAIQLAKENNNSFTTIVAAGGDGTVNEVAQSLIHSSTKLAIIPRGSGNGFAGHLDIPKNTISALNLIKKNEFEACDVLEVNGNISCNTSGIGFDGKVAHLFGQDGKRGFWSYFKIGLKEYRDYEVFDVTINGKLYKNIFTIEIANSSQLGNDAIISPHSSVTDGIAEIVLFIKPKWWQVPIILYRVFNQSFHKSPLTEILFMEEGHILINKEIDYHIDGEYIGKRHEFGFKIIPKCLNVICNMNT